MDERAGWRVGAGVILVLLGGLLLWPTEAEELATAPLTARARSDIAATAEIATAPRAATSALALPAVDSAGVPTEASGSGRVHGSVTDEQGRPVAGLAVTAIVELDSAVQPEARAHGRTDAAGRYALDLPAPAWLDVVQIGPGPHTIPTEGKGKEDTLLPGGELLVDVTVGAGCTLVGRVVDEHGTPQANAQLRAWLMIGGYPSEYLSGPPDRELTADTEGRFEVSGLGPGFVVEASTPSRLSRMRLEGRLRRGRHELPEPMVVVPAREVAFTARDTSGEPVAVRVSVNGDYGFMALDASTGIPELRWQAPRYRLVTDAEGTAVKRLVATETHDLTVRDERFPRWQGSVEPGSHSVDIELGAGRAFELRVVDARGAPVVGALALLEQHRGELETTTDHDGWARFDGVDMGIITWAVLSPDHALAVGHDYDEEPLIVRLKPRATVHLRVLDGDGRPRQGARAILSDWYSHSYWLRDRLPVVSDANGRITLDVLQAGTHALAISDGLVEVTLEAETGPDEVVVRLAPANPVTIEVHVVDARTREPLAAGVRHLEAGYGHQADDGIWVRRLRDVPATLSVSAPGYAPHQLAIEQPSALAGPLVVALHANRSVAVAVRDADGATIDASLLARLEDGTRLPVSRDDLVVWFEGTRQVFGGLPARLVEFEVSNRELGARTSQWVDLTDERVHEVELVLHGGARRTPRFGVYVGASAGTVSAKESWTALLERSDELTAYSGNWTVSAFATDGTPRGSTTFPDAAGREQGAAPWATLDVPAEPLTFRIDIAGQPSAEFAWTPARSADESDRGPMLAILDAAALER